MRARVFYLRLDDTRFKVFIMKKMITYLMDNFPEETLETIKKLR